jgi:hypothetical protein
MSFISEQINQKFEYGKLKNQHKNVAIDLKIHVFQVRNLSDDVVVKEVFELDSDSQIKPQLKNDEKYHQIQMKYWIKWNPLQNLFDSYVLWVMSLCKMLKATCCHFTEFLCRIVENHQLS